LFQFEQFGCLLGESWVAERRVAGPVEEGRVAGFVGEGRVETVVLEG
jgi:hypothetical protein